MGQTTREEFILTLRSKIKEIGIEVNAFKKEYQDAEASESDIPSEILANLTLSFRHLEDASMRLGKVLQAMNNGVSVYDDKEDNSVMSQK